MDNGERELKTSNLEVVKDFWEKYRLPKNMSGLSFLDVGCWSGGYCAEAVRRDASRALGIDVIKSPYISIVQKKYSFDFMACDVFSETFLALPRFDIVLCRGVIYHVENPVMLIYRLKSKTIKKLFLETAVMKEGKERGLPLIRLIPHKEAYNDISTWWIPNELAVRGFLDACGFIDVSVMHREETRICFRATPSDALNKKILPRREKYLND